MDKVEEALEQANLKIKDLYELVRKLQEQLDTLTRKYDNVRKDIAVLKEGGNF